MAEQLQFKQTPLHEQLHRGCATTARPWACVTFLSPLHHAIPALSLLLQDGTSALDDAVDHNWEDIAQLIGGTYIHEHMSKHSLSSIGSSCCSQCGLTSHALGWLSTHTTYTHKCFNGIILAFTGGVWRVDAMRPRGMGSSCASYSLIVLIVTRALCCL